MLILLTLIALGVWATLVAAALAVVVDAVERRRRRRVIAQIRVTDAVHGALGPIVAPTVARRGRRAWVVRMGLAARDLREAGRLVELALRAMRPENGPVRVVLTPRSA